MKKITYTTILTLVLLIPGLTSASASSCLQFKYSPSFGSDNSNTNGEVSMIQQFLKDRSYFSGSVDGLFNIDTAIALVKFQKANGIPLDVNPFISAVVGPKTKAKIIEITCPVRIKAIVPIQTPTQSPSTVPTPSYSPAPTYSPTPTAAPTYYPSPIPSYSPTPSTSPTPSSSPTPSYSPSPSTSVSPSSSPRAYIDTNLFKASVWQVFKILVGI